MQPYAASLPDKSQMYNRHMLLPAHLPLLQDARLVRVLSVMLDCKFCEDLNTLLRCLPMH